jgi:hypothetical protein
MPEATEAERNDVQTRPARDLSHVNVFPVARRAPVARRRVAQPGPEATPLAVSMPSDPAEREADTIATRVMSAAPPRGPLPVTPAAAAMPHRIGREDDGGPLARGSRAGEMLRRGRETPATASGVAAAAFRAPGEPLPASERGFFEERLGFDLSPVRIHRDHQAAEAARALNAEAFTLGRDVAFAKGRFQPDTAGGRRLLAHELVHVIQHGGGAPLGEPTPTAPQVSAGGAPRISRRAADGSEPMPPSETEDPASLPLDQLAPPASTAAPAEATAPAPTAAGGLIVEDEARALDGQMRKSEFLDALKVEACAAADRELARAGRDTQGCPHLPRLLDRYSRSSAAHLERTIRRFVPQASTASTARGYIPLVAERMADGVRTWVDTGQVPADLPEDMRADLGAAAGASGFAAAIGGAITSATEALGGAMAPPGGMFFKAAPGGARAGADPTALSARLGTGRDLEGSTRTRMESAFGESFGDVRIHDDQRAAGLANQMNARAFTVGSHVGFAASVYAPGSAVGDAILAHELAHVLQQRNATGASAAAPLSLDGGGHDPLEAAADDSAAAVVTQLHGTPDGDRQLRTVRKGAVAGKLRIQRCRSNQPQTPRTETTPYGTFQVVADSTGGPLLANTVRQTEFANLQQAWTRVNDNSGGLIINGSAANKATLIGMFGREMGRSRTFRDLIVEITADRAHPVTIEVGRDNASWLDAFANNSVDLNDLEWLDDVPPPRVPFSFTQGEDIVHWLAERRHAALNAAGFDAAHAFPMQPGGLQEQYRAETGQSGRTVSQVRINGAGGLHQGVYTDTAGNRIVISRDDSGGDPVPYKMQYFAAGNATALLTRVNNVVAAVSATGGGSGQVVVRFSTSGRQVDTPAQAVGGSAADFVSPLEGVVPTGATITVTMFRVNASGPNTSIGSVTWNHPFAPTTTTISSSGMSLNVALRLRRN